MADLIRFYFDQHVSPAVAMGLRQQSVDVLTAQEAARCGMPDPDQLQFAATEERVMFTFDSDYLALHQSGIHHAGICWCRATKFRIGELIRALLLVHGVMDRDAMRGHLEYL